MRTDTHFGLQTPVFWSLLPNAAVLAVNLAGTFAARHEFRLRRSSAGGPRWKPLLSVTLPFLACAVFVRVHLTWTVGFLRQRQALSDAEQTRMVAWLLATDYRVFMWTGIPVAVMLIITLVIFLCKAGVVFATGGLANER